jgi:hypothetical protein
VYLLVVRAEGSELRSFRITNNETANTVALLSDDKLSHLSHVILQCLKRSAAGHLKGEEAHVLREIKRVLGSELHEEAAIDETVRGRLRSYSRPIVEGSQEWDVLYRKAYEEESRKRRKG